MHRVPRNQGVKMHYRGRLRRGFPPLLCVLSIVSSLSCVQAAQLTPHRAEYKVSLVSATPGTGIANLDGVLVSDWDQSCEGWTLDQKMGLTIYNARGEKQLTMISNVSTWESADGRLYRFSVNNESPGGESEEIEGSAELPGDGEPGTARFTKPEPKVVLLPKGTLFPTAHAVLVLQRAAQAPTILSRKVFDGLAIDGLNEINAVLGRPIKAPAKMPQLAGRRSWQLNLAFFKADSGAAEPDQEISMRLFDNGVGEDMLLDFGNFKAKAVLDKLVIGKHPVCK